MPQKIIEEITTPCILLNREPDILAKDRDAAGCCDVMCVGCWAWWVSWTVRVVITYQARSGHGVTGLGIHRMKGAPKYEGKSSSNGP